MTEVIVKASDGVKLAGERSGAGPPLLAIHGGPLSDRRSFGRYLDPIATYRELFLLDQRGSGDSDDAPASSYTLDRLAQDVDEFRQWIGHESFDILAHSFGGTIALTYARRWPHCVRSLILVDAVFRGWRGVLSAPSGWPIWIKAFWFTFRGSGDFAAFHLAHEVGNPDKREEVARLLRTVSRFDERRVRPLTREGFRPIAARDIASRVPILGLYGKQDRRFLGAAAYLGRIGATIHLIDRAGHFPFVEQPESFHRLVRQFLTTVSP